MDLRAVHECTRTTYNDIADIYHERFHDEMNEKPFDREFLDRFSQQMPHRALICDAGCGPSAQIGRYLSAKGFEVFGIDISDRCIEIARRCYPGLSFIRTDFLDWDQPADSLDAIISYYSIIYTPKRDLGLLLDVFMRTLKAGGTLIIVVKKGAYEGFQDRVLDRPATCYWSEYTEDELSTRVLQAGFVIDEIVVRVPYDDEINSDRLYCTCRKPMK